MNVLGFELGGFFVVFKWVVLVEFIFVVFVFFFKYLVGCVDSNCCCCNFVVFVVVDYIWLIFCVIKLFLNVSRRN